VKAPRPPVGGLGGLIKDDGSGPWESPGEFETPAPLDSLLTREVVVSGDSLYDALSGLSASIGVGIVFDPAALEARLDVAPDCGDTPIPVGSALTKLLAPSGLSWDRRFSVLLIATPERLSALPSDPPALSAPLDALAVTFSFASLPLDEALDHVALIKGIPIVLSTKVAGRVIRERVTLAVMKTPLADALALLLYPRGLTCRVQGGLIVVEAKPN
jgi:hypothetical protein